MKTKRILTLVLALLMVFSLAAVASADAEEAEDDDFDPSEYPVAICMYNYNHPVHRSVQLGFLKRAEELGYTDAQIIGTELVDESASYQQALQFAKSGGKAMAVWAAGTDSWEMMKHASDAGCLVGVPHFNHIIQNDGELPEGLSFNMGCDGVATGKKAANFMAEKLDGKEGSICISLYSHNLAEDTNDQAFRDEWEALGSEYDLSKIKILDTVIEGGDLVEATSILQGIITSNPDLIAAVSFTDGAMSWSNAATNAGKADGEICILSMNATDANLAALEEGKVQGLLVYPFYDMAMTCMDYFDTIFRGGTVPEWTDFDMPLVTVDGEGPNSIEYHRELAQEVVDYFGS